MALVVERHLETEVRRYEELATSLQSAKLVSEKDLRRAAQALNALRTSDGRLGLLLADASGHGLAPTMIVSQVRALVRAFADDEKDPRKILSIANKRLYEDLGDGRFVTTFLKYHKVN